MGLLSALLSQLNFRKSAQTEETEEKPQQVLESLDLQGVAKYIESGKGWYTLSELQNCLSL